MSKKKIPLYRARVSAQDTTGIFAMSFVDYPANESHFVALNKSQIKIQLNKAKQILTGAVLIPEQRIYRNDTALGEYYMTFKAEDIEDIAQKMMKAGKAIKMTTHQHESDLSGNYLTELWIVKDSKRDKSVALGLGEFPVGTLMASYKIEDAKYWRDEVLTGNVKGFSLEGFFNFNSITMSKTAKPAAQVLGGKKPSNKVSAFLRSLAVMMEGDTAADADALAGEADKDETDSGTPVIIFELADGGEVYVDADGYATLNGEQIATGEHALADGNFIVIDENGNLVVTQEEADAEEPAAAEAALKAAREAGKAFLAAQNKKNPNASKIAKLEAELAKLKAQPSTPKAKPAAEAIDPSKMTHTQKLAAIVASRLGN